MRPGRFRPRFTVRRLMVAVAVLAVGLGVSEGLKRRAARLRNVAAWHMQGFLITGYHIFNVGDHDSRSDYHLAMARKYEDAARRPWMLVAPDPPVPD